MPLNIPDDELAIQQLEASWNKIEQRTDSLAADRDEYDLLPDLDEFIVLDEDGEEISVYKQNVWRYIGSSPENLDYDYMIETLFDENGDEVTGATHWRKSD